MIFKDIGIAFLISFLSFVLQIWPRIKNRFFGIDTWRFLLLADYIRKNRKLPESIPEKYIVPGSVDNPPVLPILLSLFPKKWLEKNQSLISPLFDFLHSLTLFIMGYYITKNPLGGYMAQIIYALTPVVPLEASNLSLRTLSSLTFTWVMFSVQAYVMSPSVMAFCIAVALIVLLAYTHRMSMQVLFFLLLIFAMIDKNPAYLIIFFLGLSAAVFPFKGLYLRYLRGQLLLISFWMYNIQNRLAHQVRGNPTPKKRHVDFVRRMEYLINKIPVLPFIAVNPWILFVFFAIGANINNGMWPPILIKWSLSLFILGIIFNIKYLRFLGEGQRYLEYGTGAVALTASFIILKLEPGVLIFALVLLLTLICLGIILFMQRKVVLNNPDKSITPALWSVIEFLNKWEGEVRIACIPHSLADALAYFLNNGKVLLSDNSIGVWTLQDFWPFIKKPLKDTADTFGLNFYLISTNYVRLDEINIPDFENVFEEDNYILLQRKK